MKSHNRILTLCFMFLLLLQLCACGVSSQSGDLTPNSSAPASETRTITDSFGRQVTLPATIERIVPLGNAPRMATYLGLAEKFVGVPECEHADNPIMAYAYVNRELWADLPNVGNDSLGAGEWYAEEILACSPDVILCTYEGSIADDIQTQTGIPVVAVSSPELFSEDYNDALRILGEACGVSDRAEELIAFLNSCLDDLSARTTDIPDEEKPTVLGAGATFQGSHSIDGVYANYPVFRILSAKDAALGISEKSGGLLVDKEQILLWDPDIIFFDAGSMGLISMDYAENPSYFSQLQAVRNGELYQWPNSTWHYSNVEIPLVTAYYVGGLLYPDAFSDISFEEKAAEIFTVFLDSPDYLQTLKDAGAGYGKVVLEGHDAG